METFDEDVDVINSDDVTASKMIQHNMTEYMRDTIKRVFPSAVDGLITVSRRILWCTYPARNKLRKGNALSSLINEYHVHSPASILRSIEVHCQPWKTYLPLLKIVGAEGTYSGDSMAAARYFDGIISDMVMDIFFSRNSIRTFPMEPAENGEGIEPIFLIPNIPTALMNTDQGLAPGFRFYNVPIGVNSTCNAAIKFLDIRQKNPVILKRRAGYVEMAEHLIPDPPIPGLLRNTKEMYSAYSSGDFSKSVIVDGVVEVTKNAVVIRTIHSGEILNYREKIEKIELNNPNSWFSKTFSNFLPVVNKNYADHTFFTKRGIEPFRVLDGVKKFYRFTTPLKSYPNWTNAEGRKEEMTPLGLIEVWYTERYRSVLNQLRIEQTAAITDIRHYKALIVAAKHPQEIFDAFKNSDTTTEAAQKIISMFPELSLLQAKYLFELRHRELTKLSRDELFSKIEGRLRDLERINADLLKIDSVIKKDIEGIRKKYGNRNRPYEYRGMKFDDSERVVKIPCFIGICCVRKIGYVQFFDYSELIEIIRTHGVKDVEISIYSNPSVFKIAVDLDNNIDSEKSLDLPQVFAGNAFAYSIQKLENSIVITEDGKIFGTKGLAYREPPCKTFFVGNKFIGVSSTGQIKVYKFNDFQIRKSVNSMGVLTDIIHISNDTRPDTYVLHINKQIPNVLRLNKVENGTVDSLENSEILYVGSDDDIGFSVQDSNLNRTNNKHFIIKNIKRVFTKTNRVTMVFNTLKFSDKGITTTVKNLSNYIKEITVT